VTVLVVPAAGGEVVPQAVGADGEHLDGLVGDAAEMAGRSHRMIGGAAALLVAAGVVAVAVEHEPFVCSALRARLAAIIPQSGTAAQRWEDIYVLQYDVSEGLRLRHEYDRLGCRPAFPETNVRVIDGPGSG
jgi:hypothetical protein